jgi:hypothetical protein
LPQQSTAPSILTPHAWNLPVVTEANIPAGGDARPEESDPQQANVPSALTPQVYNGPALTDMNDP